MGIQLGVVYKITNLEAATVLGVSGDDNRSLIGYDDDGSNSRQWRAETKWEEDDRGWALQAKDQNKFLSDGGSPAHGSRAVVKRESSTWYIIPDEWDQTKSTIMLQEQPLAVALTSSTPGTPVTLASESNSTVSFTYAPLAPTYSTGQ